MPPNDPTSRGHTPQNSTGSHAIPIFRRARPRRRRRQRRLGAGWLFAFDSPQGQLGTLRRWRRADRRPPFRCPRCTYDAMDFKGKPCPECGLLQDPAWRRLPPRAGRGIRVKSIRSAYFSAALCVLWCPLLVFSGVSIANDWIYETSEAPFTGTTPPLWPFALAITLMTTGCLFTLLALVMIVLVARARTQVIYGPRRAFRTLRWAQAAAWIPLWVLLLSFFLVVNLAPYA